MNENKKHSLLALSTFIPLSFSLIETSLKLSFRYIEKVRHCILFNICTSYTEDEFSV